MGSGHRAWERRIIPRCLMVGLLHMAVVALVSSEHVEGEAQCSTAAAMNEWLVGRGTLAAHFI
jgi:hypothetical protein